MAETPTPEQLTESKALGLALRRMRKRADLTQEEAAARAEVAVQSWRRYEGGVRDLPLTKIADLAKAVGSTLEEILHERSAMLGGIMLAGDPLFEPSPSGQVVKLPAPRALPVRDRVQAGAWLEAEDINQREPRFYPVAPDPRYPQADQWLSEVVGDSVDRLRIYDGDLVQCVDAIAIDYRPRTGDIVEAERTRFQGAYRELTIKQVEVADDGRVLLWPRSTNPRWQGAIELTSGLREGEEAEVRIRSLVIASYRRF